MDTGDDKINSQKSSNKFDKIKLAYEKTIPEKVKLLTDSIHSAQQYPDKEHFTELQNIVHKMGGSAGSYGYKSISIFCKEMDSEIGRRADLGELADEAWLASLDDFLSKMLEGFHFYPIVHPKNSVTPLVTNLHPFLYVVDEDTKFLELLMRIKDQFSIEIETESDPKKALDRLMLDDFNPSIVIVSQIFPTTRLSGFDLIAKIRSKKGAQLIHFGLFLDQDTIENRIAASHLDINYIFSKPISAHVLLQSMENALHIDRLSAIKVLVVDDDIDFCNYATLVLSELGINVHSIQDSTTLFKTLQEFHPNVLLLDFILPKYDGLHVLKTLRQDVSYHNLIVIVVTSSEEEKIRIDAYAENADEILYKPIDKELLQKRIVNLFERQSSVIDLPGSERYTGLGNLSALKEAIGICLATSKSLKQYLVLFEIEHFAELQKQGAGILRNLVVSISNQLQWEADSHMKCFSYKLIFAVIFDAQTIQEIEKKMNDFLLNIIETENRLHPTFNCSILPITANFANADQVLKAAEIGLSEASSMDSTPIKIFKTIPKDDGINKKEIVIVDSDQELLKILRNAFESHGIIVNTYSEGGDALKALQTYTENHLPSLIIAERMLPDMDGMDLYAKLKERFREDIPFYILTVFASDKDISDGIKRGILEYIVKPFNISLLIQKALKNIVKS